MIRIATAAVFAILLWPKQSSAQNIITPRDTFLEMLAEAQTEPTHAVWFYIAGLIGGANLGNIANTGQPLICDAHKLEEQERTTEVIMDWLVRHGHLGNPDFLLEVAAPLAFAEEYPCTEI